MSQALSETVGIAEDHPHPNYMAVFYALFGLTLAEVGITYVPMVEWILIVILLAMALIKAGLVAAYFMHLKYDNKLLTLVATTPLFLVAVAIAVLAFEYTNHSPTEAASASRAAPLHAEH